jgi:hypothetical protein
MASKIKIDDLLAGIEGPDLGPEALRNDIQAVSAEPCTLPGTGSGPVEAVADDPVEAVADDPLYPGQSEAVCDLLYEIDILEDLLDAVSDEHMSHVYMQRLAFARSELQRTRAREGYAS